MTLRWLMAIVSGLTALNAFLIAYPGDLVPQIYLLIIGGVTAFASAVAAYMSKPV